MKFSELIDHAIECIKTYNEVIKTLDSHGDEYVKKVSLHAVRAPEVLPWQSILIGCPPYSFKTPTNECLSNRFSTASSATLTSSR